MIFFRMETKCAFISPLEQPLESKQSMNHPERERGGEGERERERERVRVREGGRPNKWEEGGRGIETAMIAMGATGLFQMGIVRSSSSSSSSTALSFLHHHFGAEPRHQQRFM